LKNAEPSTEFRKVWQVRVGFYRKCLCYQAQTRLSFTQYNNHFYNLAAIVVERVSGIPFFDFAREHLFKAIGFEHTSFYSQEIAESGQVTEGFWRHGETNSSKGTIQATNVLNKLDLRATGAASVLASGDDVVSGLVSKVEHRTNDEIRLCGSRRC